MKEMRYTNEAIPVETLDEGVISGLPFKIVSNGLYPCAYVGLPLNHKLAGKEYLDNDDLGDIECNGGLTYSKYGKIAAGESVYWLGWDYAHLYDFTASRHQLDPDTKKWTTEEIKAEVISVINQIKKLEVIL